MSEKRPRSYFAEIVNLPTEEEREAAIKDRVPKHFHDHVRDLINSELGKRKYMQSTRREYG